MTSTQQIGLALAALMSAYMALNMARALRAPTRFAAYLGLPLDTRPEGFVQVYALRAAFIAALAAMMVAARDRHGLFLLSLAGLIMPLGDAVLTARAGAGTAVVARHLIVALFVGAVAALLA